MVQTIGNAAPYVGGTQGIALPRRDDPGVRRNHEPAKPRPTGLDWDALTPVCKGCGQRSGQLAEVKGAGELCPPCRGVKPTKAKKGKRTGYAAVQLPEDELLRRFTGPDDTQLGRDLAELEATDPDVAAAAAALDGATARITRPDDHVQAPKDPRKAGNQGGPTTRGSAPRATSPSSIPGSVPGAGSAAHQEKNPAAAQEMRPDAAAGLPDNVTALPPRYSDEANLDAQVDHAERVLRDTAGSDDHVVRLLRLNVLSALEALYLYTQLYVPQTPAPAASPRPAGAGPHPPKATTEPSPSELGGAGRPAARTEGEAVARPATTRGRRVMDTDEARRQRAERRRTGPTTRGVTVDEPAIVREYLAGDSAPVVAARHGIRPKRVRDIVVRHGGTLRDDRKTHSGGRNRVVLDDTTIAELTRLYVEEQLTIQELATRFDRARKTITDTLRNAGVQIRPAAHQTGGTDLTDDQKASIVQRYVDGAAIHALASEHHVRVKTVRELITAAGHAIRPKGASTRNAERIRALGATPAQVRAWAIDQGLIEPGTPGLLPSRVIEAYEASRPNHPTGDTTA